MSAPIKHAWLRNLLFLGLCLVGLGAVGNNLLSRNRIEPPRARDAALPTSDSFQATLRALDREFRETWQEYDLQPTNRADDLAIARRLALGLCGTVPSVEEIRALEAQPADKRVQWFVSHLLEDRRSADYLAERFARAYVGTENGPFLVYRRRRFVSWLSDKLHENAGYDQIVRELIADTGLWTSSPAVNFVTVTLDSNQDNQPDEIRLAARTTRAFLGMRIDCLQCHEDKLAKFAFGADERSGEQQDFHRLAAFFTEAKQSPTGVRDQMGREYEYQYLHAKETEKVEPQVPFQAELVEPAGPRRQQLARWVTHPENKMFARATVNRVWALMVGRPLVQPIDDIALTGPYPPGLETLAEDFVQHDYNLRRLVRLIAATEAYQRDSRADFEITAAHENHWAAFPLSRLRPEQVAGSLIQAASLATIDAHAHIVTQLTKFGQTQEFVQRYGDTGDDEFTDRGGTITQRLLMMNGNLVKERTDNNIVINAATRLAQLASDENAIESAYLATLTRRPSDEERAAFKKSLTERSSGDSRSQAVEDMYWVLLNSTEFSW
ncbi:MAG TPA: DUF1553 domain-containing protein, partial [Pirellulaceae bacterium]|nr:DUF1553 domain-containing protein [Pirellulaceae bacterium]